MPRVDKEEDLRWRDQLGKVYRVPQMTTSHIKNSMKYLLREAERLHDMRTVGAFQKVVDSNVDLEKEANQAMVEYWFEHLTMTPTEYARRLDIMWAFHHELQKRRVQFVRLAREGVANFEFPA